jgi:hypothetical protein
LRGAGEIAREVFGRDTDKNRRRIYHLHATRRLPTWRDGENGPLLTRRSLLQQHYAGPPSTSKS